VSGESLESQRLKPHFFRVPYDTAEAVPYKPLSVPNPQTLPIGRFAFFFVGRAFSRDIDWRKNEGFSP